MIMASGIGSARHDENGKYVGGKAGDQLQGNGATNDVIGEVSMQTMYTPSKGWYVLRPKSIEHSHKIACGMVIMCNNKNVGYSQLAARKVYDVASDKPINLDCSLGVRSCIYYGTGKDVGNFSTKEEASVLERSGLFEPKFKYISEQQTPLYIGDVLVTCTKGHTAIVVAGKGRSDTSNVSYYPKYTGKSTSLVDALKAVGVKDTSKSFRTKIAAANGISNYRATGSQNLTMLKLLKQGKLVFVQP